MDNNTTINFDWKVQSFDWKVQRIELPLNEYLKLAQAEQLLNTIIERAGELDRYDLGYAVKQLLNPQEG